MTVGKNKYKEDIHKEKETVMYNKLYFYFSQDHDASHVQKDTKPDPFL